MKYSADQLERDIHSFLEGEPFYGHFFQGLGRVLTREIPTAGVCWNGEMYLLKVNPAFFGKLPLKQKLAVLKHEVLHLVFRHITRSQGKISLIYNIAADLVVNQLCSNLPPGALQVEDYEKHGLLKDETAEEYYEKLLKIEPQIKAATGQEPDRGSKQKPSLDAVWREATPGNHDGWKPLARGGPESDAADWKAGDLALQAQENLQIHDARHWGSLPEAIRRELQKIGEERSPRVDWRRALRMFASKSSQSRRIATLRRPSRRFGTHPGTRTARRKRLLVAVDTSGSTLELREEFFAELHQIWRNTPDIWVVECDANVGSAYRFTGETPGSVTGGGGTSFQPVFDWMRSAEALAAPHRGHFDGCIYFTDGWGPRPVNPPPCPLLWVLPPTKKHGTSLPSRTNIKLAWSWLCPGEVIAMNP